MFYAEKVASETTINLEDRRECEDVMDRIYKEDPSKWPHGLHMSGFDGGCYMIREASSGKSIGFTGWQEKRASDGKRVGYYSIGILPEYRRNGFAKAAVSQLLKQKSAGVNRVEAFIAQGNRPSIALADRLGVPVVYAAHTKRASLQKAALNTSILKNSILPLLGGAGLTEIMDRNAGGNSFFGDLGKAIVPGGESGNMDANRLVRGISNAVSGALGGYGLKNIGKGIRGTGTDKEFAKGVLGLTAAVPSALGTDLLANSIELLSKTAPALDKYINQKAPVAPAGMSNKAKLLLGLVGVAGAGGLGWLMHKGNQATQDLADAAHEGAGSRIKLTLPTKDPDDVETRIDMPMHEVNLSKNIQGQISRDTRRRLREEGKGRTERKWNTKKLKEDEEVEDEEVDDKKVVDFPKAASHIRSMQRVQALLK